MEKIVCPYCGREFSLAEAAAAESFDRVDGRKQEKKNADIRAKLQGLKEQLMKEQEHIICHLLELERKKSEQEVTLTRIEEATVMVDNDDRRLAEELLRACGWTLDP